MGRNITASLLLDLRALGGKGSLLEKIRQGRAGRHRLVGNSVPMNKGTLVSLDLFQNVCG